MHLDNEHERLTNVPYAHDICGVQMVELLVGVLREFCLERNSFKTKMLSIVHIEKTTTYCIIDYGGIAILGVRSKRKYLGRMFTRNIKQLIHGYNRNIVFTKAIKNHIARHSINKLFLWL